MGFIDDIRKAGQEAADKAKEALGGDKDAEANAEAPPEGDAVTAGAPQDDGDPSFTEAIRQAGRDAQGGGADTAEASAEPAAEAPPAPAPEAPAAPPPAAAPPRPQAPAAKAAPKAAPPRGGAIPASKHQAAAPKRRTYTVKPGDTLSAIGQRYGVDWRKIAKANKIPNPDLIYPGQTFVIPED